MRTSLSIKMARWALAPLARSLRSRKPLARLAPRSLGPSPARSGALASPALARHLARSASRLLNPSLARPCLERKPRATDAPGPVSGRHSVTSICDLLACTGMCEEGVRLRQWARACLC